MTTELSGEKRQSDRTMAIKSPRNEQRHLIDLYEDAPIDPVYQAKAHILNQAIQEIGMGRYQVGRVNYFALLNAYSTVSVVSVRRHWVWVVCVSISDRPPFQDFRLKVLITIDSDSVWPVCGITFLFCFFVFLLNSGYNSC